MSKATKKVEKSSRKLTDFFARRDSSAASSQPSSSQPSSSQPTPSQKNILKPTQERRQPIRRGLSLRSAEVEVISVSSGNEPICISSDTQPSHISISSGTSSNMAVAVSGTNGQAVSKGNKISVSLPQKSAKEPLKPVPPQASAAKTTVKRRNQASAAMAPCTSSTKPTRRKRKADWSSEESEGLFVPDPTKMNPALTRVPVFGVPHPNTDEKRAPDVQNVPSSPSARSQRSSTSKRARITPRDPPQLSHQSGNEADLDELVPSSQSDEQELTLPKVLVKDPEVVKENVDRWRRETSVNVESSPPLSDYPLTSPTSPSTTHDELLPAPLPVDYDGDVDMEGPSGPIILNISISDDKVASSNPESESEAEVRRQLAALTSSDSSLQRSALSAGPSVPPSTVLEPSPFDDLPDNPFLAPTPPPMVVEPEVKRPATPVALDPQTKAAQIIAQIKAAAAQNANRSSSEEPELRDISDSSSDESDAMFFSRKPKKSAIPSSPLTAVTSSPPSAKQSEAGPSRYQLRRRSSPTARVPSPDVAVARPARKSINPLDKLLREKKTAVRFGKDIEGMRAAEAIAQASSSKTLRDEMDEEEDSDTEARARTRGSNGKSNGADTSDSEEELGELDLTEATKQLGDKEGEAVGKIISTDRKGWLLKGKGKAVPSKGVPLWRDDLESDETMDDDLPPLPITPGDDHVLSLLKSVSDDQDPFRLSRFLNPQLLSRVRSEHTEQLCEWLFTIAVSPDESPASTPAFQTLLGLAMRGVVIDHLSSWVASALWHLGARAAVLEASGLPVQQAPQHAVESETRLALASRIVSIVRAFAENALLANTIPDLILELVLIGMDPSTTDELASDIMVAIDVLGAGIQNTSSGFSDVESLVCKKVVALAKDFSPANKAHLLAFFCGGCSQMSRVTRWIAYYLISKNEFDVQAYNVLPPLLPLIHLTSPTSGSQTTFDVVGNAEEDDYFDNLHCHVHVLNVVLNDVPSYTRAETRHPPQDATPGGEKPQTELQRLKHCLDVLHGKIVDTRAAHLDRSRVKAALQQLSFRVHYQREAAVRSTGRPRNLRGYFSKPTTS